MDSNIFQPIGNKSSPRLLACPFPAPPKTLPPRLARPPLRPRLRHVKRNPRNHPAQLRPIRLQHGNEGFCRGGTHNIVKGPGANGFSSSLALCVEICGAALSFASSACSVHCFPQLSHRHELTGSAPSSTGSAAPQLGQTGGS